MAIIDIIEAGRQGLAANRQALQTTSNNIANANTPGYSRQKAVFTANESVMGGVVRTPGVEIKRTVRLHDEFIQKQIVEENKTFGALQAKSEALQRIESLIHTDQYRLGDMVNKFFNDVRELSASPETYTLRNQVSFSAKNAAHGFRALNDSMKNLKLDLDERVKVGIEQVNTMSREVADLNNSISTFKARGDAPLEMLDRRDALVRDLSSKLGCQLTTDDMENTNLVAGRLGVLVNGGQHNELVVMRTPEREGKTAGSLDIFIKEGNTMRPITGAIDEGEIGGMLYARDKIINPSLKHLDEVAFRFSNAVNDVHREGIGADGQNGRDLFRSMESAKDASAIIDISDAVKRTAEVIAVGETLNAPGDNRIALKLTEIQNQLIMPDNPSAKGELASRQTLNDSLNSLIGNIGVQSQQETEMFKHQEAIVKQLESYRQTTSGVNLEEEAVNVMQYQTAFNAASKAMKVGDELMQTILSLRP